MITQARDYYNFLYRIQDQNPPTQATLPNYNNVYEIDLDSRVITAPDFISVTRDHMSETIYFKCPRYYETVDLASTVGVIEFVNAAKKAYIYPIPYYDLTSLSTYNPETKEEDDCILFPWVVDGAATEAAGNLTFAVRFYRIDASGEILEFNLNTLPTTTIVKQGLVGTEYKDYEEPLAGYAEKALQALKEVSDVGVYWIDL